MGNRGRCGVVAEQPQPGSPLIQVEAVIKRGADRTALIAEASEFA